MKKLAFLFALALCVALAGCNQPAPPQGGEPSEPQEIPEVDVIITEPEEPAESLPPAEGPAEPTAPAVGQVAMVILEPRPTASPTIPLSMMGS